MSQMTGYLRELDPGRGMELVVMRWEFEKTPSVSMAEMI
jgi:hypothetical protein